MNITAHEFRALVDHIETEALQFANAVEGTRLYDRQLALAFVTAGYHRLDGLRQLAVRLDPYRDEEGLRAHIDAARFRLEAIFTPLMTEVAAAELAAIDEVQRREEPAALSAPRPPFTHSVWQ